MLNKIFILVFSFLLLNISIYSQDNKTGISSGPAPYVKVQYPSFLLKDAPNYFYSRAFAYNAYGGTIPLGPCKFWLNGTGLTSLFNDPLGSTAFVQAGSFDANGIWWGVRYSTAAIVKIDTSTGILTQKGTVTGIGTGSITGLAWDFTTNTMYALNYVSGASTVGTLNLSTYVYTPLAGTLTTGLPIDMACSNSGQLYVHVVTSPTTQSQIYSVNKTTGIFTPLSATTGFVANYAQGMSWDHSVDTGYLAAYNYGTNAGELRKINIATGATTLIGTLICEADAMAMPGCSGPQFSHTPLPNSTNTTGPFIVNTIIIPCGSGINPYWTKILWSRNNTSIKDSVQMTNSGGYNWTGNIPGNGTIATYRYYLRTADSLGRFEVIPAGAPANLFIFIATTEDTSKPVITHTALGNCIRAYWPATILCQATNPFGVDSVWVKWNKNHGSDVRFNLAHGSGNNWANPFNSDTSQVVVGDSIFYRIIARTSSGNKDSTTLYKFKIISQIQGCIGTGLISSNYPLTTYWEDGRTDMLFLASELIASGGIGYLGSINTISFDVISVGGPTMNGFNIKMQNTSATTISAFVNSGWQTCFNGTYTVSGTGWQTITLTTTYHWNYTSNLLMEVCFNNSAWTAYSSVNATNVSGMMVGYATDLPSGDGCTAAWTATALPYRVNICINRSPLGIQNEPTVIPNNYSLFQNYPNPFNPVTQINYEIPKKGFVVLKVFDILGREVANLVNEEKQPGDYIVDFDGSNFASGVYFYKLELNEFTDVKRMVIIK
jgi:hypothetical protein